MCVGEQRGRHEQTAKAYSTTRHRWTTAETSPSPYNSVRKGSFMQQRREGIFHVRAFAFTCFFQEPRVTPRSAREQGANITRTFHEGCLYFLRLACLYVRMGGQIYERTWADMDGHGHSVADVGTNALTRSEKT